MFRIRNLYRTAGCLVLLSGLLIACGDKVEDVNRVQPYFIKKSQLEGEWYFRQMLTESPPTGAAGLLFEGLHGEGRAAPLGLALGGGSLVAVRQCRSRVAHTTVAGGRERG